MFIFLMLIIIINKIEIIVFYHSDIHFGLIYLNSDNSQGFFFFNFILTCFVYIFLF